MPTYDYLCNTCATEFEERQRITAEPVAQCPKCGGRSHRLVSGGTGLIFKGSGFYITDYKHKGADYAKSSASVKSDSAPQKSEPSSVRSDSSSQKSESAASSGEASGKTNASSPGPAAPGATAAPAK